MKALGMFAASVAVPILGGGLGRALTFTSTRGRSYALSYNRSTQSIDPKRGNFQGAVLQSFSTPHSFRKLHLFSRRSSRGNRASGEHLTEPWHFTTWLDLIDHWQALLTGL